MLIADRGIAVSYAGCFVIASGVFLVGSAAIVWLPSNLPRYGKRSAAVGLQLMAGNSAGIAAPYVSNILLKCFAAIPCTGMAPFYGHEFR